MITTQNQRTKDVTVLLTESEAERLANLLHQISSRTPQPRDDARASLQDILTELVEDPR